jgi:hypothetical protein
MARTMTMMRTMVPIPINTGYSSPVDNPRYPADPGGNTRPAPRPGRAGCRADRHAAGPIAWRGLVTAVPGDAKYREPP